MRFIFGDDWNDVQVNNFFDLWKWCNFSGIEALEFSCIYIFGRRYNTRTKSIQKQIKSIDVDKVGSKKPSVNKCFFV